MINTDYLTTLEEFDFIHEYQMPYLLSDDGSIGSKKKIAYLIMARKEDELFLVNPEGFSESSVFAGITEKQIEYFAKHAPLEYKKELVKIFSDKEMMASVWNIARAMDDDEGDGLEKNKKRITNVINYIYDNQILFQ